MTSLCTACLCHSTLVLTVSNMAEPHTDVTDKMQTKASKKHTEGTTEDTGHRTVLPQVTEKVEHFGAKVGHTVRDQARTEFDANTNTIILLAIQKQIADLADKQNNQAAQIAKLSVGPPTPMGDKPGGRHSTPLPNPRSDQPSIIRFPDQSTSGGQVHTVSDDSDSQSGGSSGSEDDTPQGHNADTNEGNELDWLSGSSDVEDRPHDRRAFLPSGNGPKADKEPKISNTSTIEEKIKDKIKGLKEPEGQALHTDWADWMNHIWQKGRDNSRVKEITARNVYPSNVSIKPTELNKELVDTLPPFAIKQDRKNRLSQALVARATVPLMLLGNSLKEEGPLDKDRVLTVIEDSMTLLAAASATTNLCRRDYIKSNLEEDNAFLCATGGGQNGAFLLGGESVMKRLDDRKKIKGLVKKRGRYRQKPYYKKGRHNNSKWTSTTFRASPVDTLVKVSLDSNSLSNAGTDSDCEMLFVGCRSQERVEAQIPELESESGQRQPQEEVAQQRQQLEPEGSRTGQEELEPEQSVSGCRKIFDINVSKWPVFEAGRVSTRTHIWRNYTSDWDLLRQLRGFTMNFITTPVQEKVCRELQFNQTETLALRTEIANMLRKKVIHEVGHTPGEFISNVFLREKKEKQAYRMILNLSDLNEFIEKIHFKMDTMETALQMVTPGCYMASLDYSDAYYSMAVAVWERKYLRFLHEGKLYEYTCLAQGLSEAPRFFTKAIKVPLSFLRQRYGVLCTGYIDDSLYLHSNGDTLMEHVSKAAELFQDLGFTISAKKSVLRPTRRIEYLGFCIDSVAMTVTLPKSKCDRLVGMTRQLLSMKKATIRFVAQVEGALAATRHATRFSALYTKSMEIDKIDALRKNRGNFDAPMAITPDMRLELNWWLENLPRLSAPIRDTNPDLTIFTDASFSGWGASIPEKNLQFGGRWQSQEGEEYINSLELLAILYGLKAACRDMSDCHIKTMTDNTTAVSGVNKQGSTRSHMCNDIARKIWFWALERNIWLTAAHIPGVQNVEADEASRKFRADREWELSDFWFQKIQHQFGTPTVDLFATRLNAKVNRFFSWQPDPDSEVIDAFTTSWAGEFFYAFPPFCLVGKVLKKVREDGARGIVVVPNWATKFWFALIDNMQCSDSLYIPVTVDTLCLHYSLKQEAHPMTGKLTLRACIVSGRS